MKYVYPVAGLAILLVCMWLVPAKYSQSKSEESHIAGEALRASAASPINLRIRQMQARRPGVRYELDAVESALATPDLWQLRPESQGMHGRWSIAFNRLKLESLLAGDTFVVQLTPGQASRTLQIQQVTHTAARVTWLAMSVDEGIGIPITATLRLQDDRVSGEITEASQRLQISASATEAWLSVAAERAKESGAPGAI